MKKLLLAAVLAQGWIVAAFAGWDPNLDSARAAQSLLGDEIWSRVIRIENTGSTASHPRHVYATVFEVADVLWIYSATEGTQYFSLRRGHVAEDKADFAPLLQAIDPGFTRWTELAPPAKSERPAGEKLRNGCFVESLASLRDRIATGHGARRPRILCYFSTQRGAKSGHAVLTFENGANLEVIDSDRPDTRLLFPLALADDARDLGSKLAKRPAAKALWVPVEELAATLVAHLAGAKTKYETAMRHEAAAPSRG